MKISRCAALKVKKLIRKRLLYFLRRRLSLSRKKIERFRPVFQLVTKKDRKISPCVSAWHGKRSKYFARVSTCHGKRSTSPSQSFDLFLWQAEARAESFDLFPWQAETRAKYFELFPWQAETRVKCFEYNTILRLFARKIFDYIIDFSWFLMISINKLLITWRAQRGKFLTISLIFHDFS